MVNKILTAAGVPHRRGRFTSPQPSTYAVWMDDIETDGADGYPVMILRHAYTIEVYESKPDDAAEAAIEAAITAEGLPWTKQDRYWLQTEQLYQVIYEFSYIEKRRV